MEESVRKQGQKPLCKRLDCSSSFKLEDNGKRTGVVLYRECASELAMHPQHRWFYVIIIVIFN